MRIEKLLQDLKVTDSEAVHEAALTLGLLIEKSVRKSYQKDVSDIDDILDPYWAGQNLSDVEVTIAIDGLINYIVDAGPNVHPMAVWALTKSNDERVVPHLIKLLHENVDDPSQEHLTLQALIGIINVGLHSIHQEASQIAVYEASVHGHGQVKETAIQFMNDVL